MRRRDGTLVYRVYRKRNPGSESEDTDTLYEGSDSEEGRGGEEGSEGEGGLGGEEWGVVKMREYDPPGGARVGEEREDEDSEYAERDFVEGDFEDSDAEEEEEIITRGLAIKDEVKGHGGGGKKAAGVEEMATVMFVPEIPEERSIYYSAHTSV